MLELPNPKTTKLIEEKKNSYFRKSNGSVHITARSNGNVSSNKSLEQDAGLQKDDLLLHARNQANEAHSNVSERFQELEEKLDRYINVSNSAVQSIGNNFKTKLNNLEHKITKLLNSTKTIQLSIKSANSEFHSVSRNLSRTFKSFNAATSEKIRQMQQETNLQLTQNTNKVEHFLQSFRADANHQYGKMNKTLHLYQQSLNQLVTKNLTSRQLSQKGCKDQKNENDTNFKQDITNKFFLLETRVNASLKNLQANQIDLDEAYLKNYVNQQNIVLQNEIKAMQSNLHTFEQNSANAVSLVHSYVDHEMANNSEFMNQSIRSWAQNNFKENEAKTKNLQALVNHEIQQTAQLQTRVNILDEKLNANTAAANKYELHLNQLSHKLEGK